MCKSPNQVWWQDQDWMRNWKHIFNMYRTRIYANIWTLLATNRDTTRNVWTYWKVTSRKAAWKHRSETFVLNLNHTFSNYDEESVPQRYLCDVLWAGRPGFQGSLRKSHAAMLCRTGRPRWLAGPCAGHVLPPYRANSPAGRPLSRWVRITRTEGTSCTSVTAQIFSYADFKEMSNTIGPCQCSRSTGAY